MFTMITSFFLIICHSHRCFQTSICSLQNIFRHITNTATIRVFTEISPALPWRLQNIPFGMPLLLHYNFLAEDLNPVTLGIASECIYTTFFWTPTSNMLCQQSEDVLFGCFVIALNAAFTQQLSLADEGYKSGSDTVDLPTPLWKTPCIHHILA